MSGETRWTAGWGEGVTGGNCVSAHIKWREDDDGVPLVCGGASWPWTIVSEGHQTVAIVPAAYDDAASGPGEHTLPIPGTEKKRARLIAAAPALYEALAEMLTGARSDCNDRNCGGCTRCRAEAALRAARGETKEPDHG